MPISEDLHKDRLGTLSNPDQVCSDCGRTPRETLFHVRTYPHNGLMVFKGRCAACFTKKYYKGIRDPVKARASNRKAKAKMTQERGAGINIPKYIFMDCRKADGERGFPKNDLTVEFIESLISAGCVYCGDTETRMTLDRIQNDKGHTQDNVVAACIRCNYARRDMPYEAWLIVADGMRKARELNLFGDWNRQAVCRKFVV